MRKLIGIILLSMAALIAAPSIHAQEETYKFDIGGQLGMSGYLGDLNDSNMFKSPGFSAGASFRYLANVRMAVRGMFNVMSLSGDTKGLAEVFPEGKQYSFKSTTFDLNGRFEFNFLPYGIGETYKKLRRLSPYVAVGLGITMSSCDGSTSIAPSLPMAVGVKYKLKERLNLGAEFSMTKVFGDKVDGELSDLHMIKSSFLKNTDWYSNISISLSYEFGKRCVTCHYVD